MHLGQSAVANDYTTGPAAAQYPLELVVCDDCTLVQLADLVPDEVVWANYGYYSSASPALVRYHEQYADFLRGRYLHLVKGTVVEIGANDGSLLRHLRPWARHVVGVEPAAGPAQVAIDQGLTIVAKPFGSDLSAQLVADYGPATLVIANNVAAHVADLPDFLGGVRDLMAQDGLAVIEVAYWPLTLLANDYTQIYHEHRYYYTLSSLSAVASGVGLVVHDAMITPPQGGSLRVVLSRGDRSGWAELPAIGRLLDRERGVASNYSSLQGRADMLAARIRDVVAEHAPVVVYGAAAKATTLLAWTGLGREISYAVDSTPAKQGGFLPGTGIPILAPPGPGSTEPVTYLLAAWNYMGDLLRRELSDHARFVVPIPTPVVI